MPEQMTDNEMLTMQLIELSLQCETYAYATFIPQHNVAAIAKQMGVSDEFDDVKGIGYEGKALSELKPEEATCLLQKKGFFSVEESASRLIEFATQKAQEDVRTMQAVKQGIIRGFEDAARMNEVPLADICHQTLTAVIEALDSRLS